jgi:CheY-like chemotaxis protein
MKKELKKILYVDDEEVNLLVFESLFRRDFNIICTFNAPDALKQLESTEVDAVISDQRMPIMTGVEFLEGSC